MTNNYIEIGQVISTFGIKGELKVKSDSDFIEQRFKVGNKVFFKLGNEYETVTISSMRIHQKAVLITVNDIRDINQVVKYINAVICIDKEDKPSLETGEYYVDDLIGLKVVDKDNTYLGVVNDVINIPSNSILEIKNEEKITLMPFVKAYIVDVVDDTIITDFPKEQI